MTDLLPADYAVFTLALVVSVTGLFRGLSGNIAFLAGTAAAGAALVFGWDLSSCYIDSIVLRAAATLVVTLLAFGTVRVIFAKSIHFLIAQPGDAIFGFLSGILFGAGIFLLWAKLGVALEYSAVSSALRSFL